MPMCLVHSGIHEVNLFWTFCEFGLAKIWEMCRNITLKTFKNVTKIFATCFWWVWRLFQNQWSTPMSKDHVHRNTKLWYHIFCDGFEAFLVSKMEPIPIFSLTKKLRFFKFFPNSYFFPCQKSSEMTSKHGFSSLVKVVNCRIFFGHFLAAVLEKIIFVFFLWRFFEFSKKTISPLRILFKPRVHEFCIFENMAAWVFDLGRPPCFWFFQFRVFHAKLKFSVGMIPEFPAMLYWTKSNVQGL